MGAVPAPQQQQVWAQKIKLTNTLLDGRRPDDPSKPWGNSAVINTLQVVAFRWQTTDQGVKKAIWQVSEENLGLVPYRKGVIVRGRPGTGSVLERYTALKSNFPGDGADGAESFSFKTGPDEAFTQAFTIKSKPAKLKFEVKGTFRVTYF